MSKKQVKIIANDAEVANEVLNFIAQNEAQMVQYIDQRLRSSGYGETDTTVAMDAEEAIVRVSSRPEDKGNVLTLDGKKLVEVLYSEIPNEAFYAYLKDGQLIVFHKFDEEGKVDKALGSVKNIKALKEEMAALPDRYRAMLRMQEEAKIESKQAEEIQEAEVVDKAQMSVVKSEE